MSYPEFIKYFSEIKTIEFHHLVIGINFVYGWMPTIFDFRSSEFKKALVILNNSKRGIIPDKESLELLKSVFNNSLVGTSKLLHFINPQIFAIWDSKVFIYLTNQKPYTERIGNCQTYLDYLSFCNELVLSDKFLGLKKSVETKVGYVLSPMRIVELVMFYSSQLIKPILS